MNSNIGEQLGWLDDDNKNNISNSNNTYLNHTPKFLEDEDKVIEQTNEIRQQRQEGNDLQYFNNIKNNDISNNNNNNIKCKENKLLGKEKVKYENNNMNKTYSNNRKIQENDYPILRNKKNRYYNNLNCILSDENEKKQPFYYNSICHHDKHEEKENECNFKKSYISNVFEQNKKNLNKNNPLLLQKQKLPKYNLIDNHDQSQTVKDNFLSLSSPIFIPIDNKLNTYDNVETAFYEFSKNKESLSNTIKKVKLLSPSLHELTTEDIKNIKTINTISLLNSIDLLEKQQKEGQEKKIKVSTIDIIERIETYKKKIELLREEGRDVEKIEKMAQILSEKCSKAIKKCEKHTTTNEDNNKIFAYNMLKSYFKTTQVLIESDLALEKWKIEKNYLNFQCEQEKLKHSEKLFDIKERIIKNSLLQYTTYEYNHIDKRNQLQAAKDKFLSLKSLSSECITKYYLYDDVATAVNKFSENKKLFDNINKKVSDSDLTLNNFSTKNIQETIKMINTVALLNRSVSFFKNITEGEQQTTNILPASYMIKRIETLKKQIESLRKEDKNKETSTKLSLQLYKQCILYINQLNKKMQIRKEELSNIVSRSNTSKDIENKNKMLAYDMLIEYFENVKTFAEKDSKNSKQPF